MAPILATAQSVIEALVFFVPLTFFMVILVRGSRKRDDDADKDKSTP